MLVHTRREADGIGEIQTKNFRRQRRCAEDFFYATQQQFIPADQRELLDDGVVSAFGILPEEQGTENFFVDETHVNLVLNSTAQSAFVIRRRLAITFFPARNRRLDDFRADVNFFAVEFTP